MEKQKPLDKRLLAVIAGLVVIIVALVFFLLFRQGTNIDDGDVPRVGYAADATVMLDQDSLQAAMDAAMAKAADGNVALLYRNNAYSENGTDFTCYIVNSPANR